MEFMEIQPWSPRERSDGREKARVFFLYINLGKLKRVQKRVKEWEEVVSCGLVTCPYGVSYLCALLK